MMSPLFLLLLPLLLLLTAPMVASSTSSYRFRQDPDVCPPGTVPATQLLSGASREAVCSVECALRPGCAVYSYAAPSRECRMGSTEDLLNSWTPPAAGCAGQTSQVNPRLPGALTFRSSLLAYLDFRVGQTNLVNAGRFGVTGQSPGVTFDSNGATFPDIGGNASFLELNTVGGAEAFGDLLGRGKNFSVYARLHRQANQTQIYYQMTDCASHNSMRGVMAHFNGQLAVLYSLANPDELRFWSGNETQPLAAAPGLVSTFAGAVFQQDRFTHGYYNGGMLELQSGTLSDPPAFTGKPECLRLGFHSEQGESLVGRYVCFAIAGKALTGQEFAQLDALCA